MRRVRRPPNTSSQDVELVQRSKAIVPRLSSAMKKGECGRIAVFGGCVMYTGAAYFAAISALKCGADLVHVFCEKEAGTVIKCYSPELIVHPVLDQEYGMEEVDHWLPRLSCLLLGPGLGRNQSMGGRISLILEKAKALKLPVVLDADALFYLAESPSMIHGYSRAVITPNPQEFSRLAQTILKYEVGPTLCPDPSTVAELSRALGGVTVVHKGSHDIISDGRRTEDCHSGGSPRRCGGQGDLLAGVLATFLTWSYLPSTESPSTTTSLHSPGVVAAWAACHLTRTCAATAFAKAGRSLTINDMVFAIRGEFGRLYESETFL